MPNAEGWRGGVSLKELGENYRSGARLREPHRCDATTRRTGGLHAFRRRRRFPAVAVRAASTRERVNFIDGGLRDRDPATCRLLDLESRTRDVLPARRAPEQQGVRRRRRSRSTTTRRGPTPCKSCRAATSSTRRDSTWARARSASSSASLVYPTRRLLRRRTHQRGRRGQRGSRRRASTCASATTGTTSTVSHGAFTSAAVPGRHRGARSA